MCNNNLINIIILLRGRLAINGDNDRDHGNDANVSTSL